MARRPAPPIDGLCVVDKPAGWTSHDVVAKARGILGTRKVGHSGTLDPDATGVLVLGVGRATRLLRFLTDLGKSYVGEVVLGTTTSTLDGAGEITATFDMTGVTLEQVRAVAARFVGEIDQIPPMVSAIKVDGRRLHELAREGIEIERKARRVTIHRIAVDAIAVPAGSPAPSDRSPTFRIEVDCGSGTYIRSLAADIGEALGGGAHLRNLRRTAVGGFTERDARGLDALELRPMHDVLRDYPRVELDEAQTLALIQGRRVAFDWPPAATDAAAAHLPGDAPEVQVAGAYRPDGELIAAVEPVADGTAIKPIVVVAPPATA